MADINPSEFKVVQVYGGLKEALFKVTSATAADVVKFEDIQRVSGIEIVMLQDADGATVPYTITGTDDEEITIGTGPSAEPLKGIVKYRSY